MSDYATFHTGHVICADGSDVPTGPLCVNADHAPANLTLFDTQSYYAHSAMGWADAHITNGDFGPWVCGALRPHVDMDDVRVLRALALSGDWRDRDGTLELAGALAVNGPGYPIARQSLAASRIPNTATGRLRFSVRAGRATVLMSAGMVGRCVECAKRAARGDESPAVARIAQMVALLERRTRHLARAEADAIRASL